METVEITFKELRTISTAVINFVEKEYWWESNKGFKTTIEEHLGITGDDGAELMSKFSHQFKVNLSSFKLDNYFHDEPTSYNPFLLVLASLLLLCLLIKGIIAGIFFLFDEQRSKQIWQYSLSNVWNRWYLESDATGSSSKISYLTMADLITSAVKGEFTQRKNIHFKLKT